MKNRTILWDFDGTILASFEIFAAVLAEAVALSSIQMPGRSVLQQNFHGSLQESIEHALELSSPEVLNTIVSDFLKIQERFYEQPNEHLYDDAVDLMERAHAAGSRQIIVTNREHENRGSASPRWLVEHSKLKPFIDAIVCGDEATYRKPDARVIDELGVNLENCLVVGDQFVDAQLAHNLGVPVVLVDRAGDGIHHLESLPEAASVTMVTSLLEVVL